MSEKHAVSYRKACQTTNHHHDVMMNELCWTVQWGLPKSHS